MILRVPNLDDRTFQDIVTEARNKIPIYCPKWTDYNLSDPGVTLIELFAWMVDMLLYRLNQVPEKNYIKFMELMGIRLQAPKSASVDVTFRLSAPQPEPVTIPTGTEVSTVRTETQDAITFITNEDATILIPTMRYVLTTFNDSTYNDVMEEIKNPYRETSVFEEIPQKDNALYIGFDEDLGAHALALTIKSSIEGIGVDPSNPPWAWEYWDKEYEKWMLLRLETDTTGGFNTSGQIILHVPVTGGKSELDNRNAFWIRCRATVPLLGQGEYSKSPIVNSIITESIGYTVSASHGSRIVSELLGQSDGNPGQQFQLQNTPVLARKPGETLEVETEIEDEYEQWQEVSSFAESGPDDLHFTCDSVSGEIQFGPSIRQTTGEERQYGKVPPAERWIRFSSYRSGGGVIGNVGKGTITVLKSSIPYIASVTNFEAAKGGIDAETLESAKFRAPHTLNASTRAVTEEDYEYLALEASPKISRAKCMVSEDVSKENIPPGTVRLLVVPAVLGNSGYIPDSMLQLTPATHEEIRTYLDQRRLLATKLEIKTPAYVWVSVQVRIKAKEGVSHQRLAADIEERLCRYINPLIGGPEGSGWPFGRNLSISDVHATIQGISGIEFVQDVQLIPVVDGNQQEPASVIEIAKDSLVCSSQHEIIIS